MKTEKAGIEVLGEVLCQICDVPRVQVGVVDGVPVLVPTALREIVSKEVGYFLLSCGHRYIGIGGLFSAQEWVAREDGTILDGAHLALVELGKGKL